VREGMKFKSLVLPSPAASELSEKLETLFLLCLQFVLHHNLRQYQHVKNDDIDGSHHAVSHV
jgi:hypothetical protein